MEKVVAWNVKMLLTARRASQLALAEALGIKKAAMSRKINGYISWSLADVVKAARFLGTTPEDLMDDTLMKKMTDAPDHAHQGALVGARFPHGSLSVPSTPMRRSSGISGAAKGALAGFIPPVVPSGTDSPSTPSKHDGIGVSGRSQAHETLGAMTTVIMRTSDDNHMWSFLALFQGFPIWGTYRSASFSTSTYRHPKNNTVTFHHPTEAQHPAPAKAPEPRIPGNHAHDNTIKSCRPYTSVFF